jgi:DNA replication protein DnaC
MTCGNAFELPLEFPNTWQYLKNCQACAEEWHQRDRAAGMAEFRQWKKHQEPSEWDKLCPPIFQETEADKLPNQPSYTKSLGVTLSKRSLLLYGKTGKGKSRTLWAILRREWLAGRKVAMLDASAGVNYASMCKQGMQKADAWVKDCSEVAILGLDDVFKSNLSPGWESMLHLIIDQRMLYRRPFILTTNDTVETLLSRMSPDRGPSLIRRLKEFCEVISF